MFNRKCKITFIAHGATIYSDDDSHSEIENYPPLNDIGQHEIENICEFLKQRGVKNDKIYTSPAWRCVQSAEPVSKLFKKEVEVLEKLQSQQLKESLPKFNKRVDKIITSLVEKNKGNRIIIVTCPAIIQAAVALALGLEPENQHKIFIKSGSATQISYFDTWASLIYSGYKPV